jgi:uncharacterized protein YndB with AHSA1/START domain
VPLHEMQERWIEQFARPRLQAPTQIRRTAEETSVNASASSGGPTAADQARPTFRYTIYIHASAEQVWQALTDAELTASYWGHANRSDWQVGSRWEHVRTDDSGVVDVLGTVLHSDPPRRLAMTFTSPHEPASDDPSVVTFVIEPFHDIVRLTVTHTRLPGPDDLDTVAVGWSSVLSNLKTLLETGSVLPQAPWDMHADLRAAQMGPNDAR